MLTTFGKNKQANSINYDAASIHTGNPTDDGSELEVSGGSPVYSRQSLTMGAAVNGARDSTNQPLFNVPAGVTVSHYALWEAGVCVDTGTLSASESFTGQGTYRLDDIDTTTT